MRQTAAAAAKDQYFRESRPEMLRFGPEDARRVLEIGCAEGTFAASVKKRNAAEVWGIEFDADAAEHAATLLDRVFTGDADAVLATIPDAHFDAIICNDVLEHLREPQATLTTLRAKLAPGGVVVASLPNIRHLAALSTVLFRRDFPQEDFGIFDRTHLRFFTRKSMRRLFDDAGFELRTIKGVNGFCGPLGALVLVLSLGFFADGFFLQYACVASAKPVRP
jgi:2-polyprenyl-3-methyl-5-hydroxy-6-metoxy-1,4-benzoquinol methylase